MRKSKFPDSFLWGASSSAFQTEGGNIWNDWYEFYNKREFFDNGCGGKVCDHYNRYKDDFDIAKSLNLNSIRISIEWSRIEKTEDVFDKTEIKHYRDVLIYLKENGFTTFVTLHHFTNPKWFSEKGGWGKKRNVAHFTNFAEKMNLELGDLVDHWLTINEPTVYSANGYLIKNFPPNKINILKAYSVIKNMSLGHLEAYRIIKLRSPHQSVGIVHNGASFIANNFLTKTIKPIFDYGRNELFLNKLQSKYDFIGINYYFPLMAYKNKQYETTDLGWPIYQQGIYDLVKLIHKKYKKPIIITENGLADSRDEKRADFIVGHLDWLRRAMDEGADVRGYLHWSLTDNLELVEGLEARFGLVEIDYKSQKRKIRKSAIAYSDYICNK